MDRRKIRRTLMEISLGMSIVAHTPVPYWLSMPVVELFIWEETLARLRKEG